MSILLDALKKSEEQRRLGETPGLHSPADHDPDDGRRRFPRWAWLLAVVILVILAAGIAWNRLGGGASPPETSAVTPAPAISTRPAGPGRALQQATAETEQTPETASRTPVERFSGSEKDTVQKKSEVPDAEKRRSLNRSFAEFTSPEPETAESPGEPVEPLAPPPELEGDADRMSDAADMPPAAGGRQPVSIWELPQNVRSSLPEFRISVMVYADDPEDRFLLVNGRRMQEGDNLNGMVLDEIRRDGAVFRFRNYRFLVEG